jgi:hypothetical protein
LTPEHDRHRPRPVTVDQRQIGVAQTAAADLDQDLTRARRIEIDFEDLNRLGGGERAWRTAGGENGSFHFHGMIPTHLHGT